MEWKSQLGVWFQTFWNLSPRSLGKMNQFQMGGPTTNQPRVLELRVSNPLQLGINSIDLQPRWVWKLRIQVGMSSSAARSLGGLQLQRAVERFLNGGGQWQVVIFDGWCLTRIHLDFWFDFLMWNCCPWNHKDELGKSSTCRFGTFRCFILFFWNDRICDCICKRPNGTTNLLSFQDDEFFRSVYHPPWN